MGELQESYVYNTVYNTVYKATCSQVYWIVKICFIAKVSRKVQRLESEETQTNNLSTSAQQVNMEKKVEKQMSKISDSLFEVSINVLLGDGSIQPNTSLKIEK